ncbi:MAG: response regulator transcription factor [Candidatus Fermentithermobacillus carboniphilus]|uniref:Response regulator transcription factor n=1 Tax=Candidatus Fermentithermobacillus carboniphilus TaxID=3085328 RepID=A0AAT9LCG4_9FIRM|nr:MAG: response regulator transcription factor [Candidatus Fermentithermobacillus carboniphilus]
MVKTIFVVEDDRNVRYLIRQYLAKEGFNVETFSSVEELRERLNAGYPHMFILDIMLPGQDGLEFCKELRQESGVPVIFVSARGDETDRIIGLELGADDYLAKPFSPKELVARVRAIFRRVDGIEHTNELLAGNVRIVLDEHRVLVGAQEVTLTPKEYDLLQIFVKRPNRVYTRQELLDGIWGFDRGGDLRAVDDLVKRLRRKLGEAGATVRITTIWGVGYRLEP